MMNTRILVVHGCGRHRDVLRNCLESQSHEVVAATDWTDGYELARWRSFDLIVFDAQLPALDGPDIIRRIREFARQNDTPALMLTPESCVTMVFADDESDRVHIHMPAQYETAQLLENVEVLLGLQQQEHRLVA